MPSFNKRSKGKLSVCNFFRNKFAESFESNSFGIITSDVFNNIVKLFFSKSVFELIIEIFQLINGEFTSSL